MTVQRCSLRVIQCAISLALLSVLILVATPSPALAGTRRAVLVGINTYNPCKGSHPNLSKLGPSRSHCSDWPDLKGSVDDAKSMKSVIELRFGFKPENVHLLLNEQATRQAILGAIQKYLIEEAQPGDVVFFYYAGHGSQVPNSLSYERDKMDQTIVPADANRGVHDIRDKTLARLFNQMLDKHLVVTAIFDSCHSGAMARGLGVPTRGRYLPAIDNRDARDPFRGPFPEDHGALILSGAQADEVADETATQPWHGVFTEALLRVLSIVPVNTSSMDIFKMVKAQLDVLNPSQLPGFGIEDQQIPNLAGKGRSGRPLFGIESKQTTRALTVAALKPDEEDKVVPLDGGLAVGLTPGSELKRIDQPAGAPEVSLEVTGASVAKALAKVTKGDVADVHRGDLFEVVKLAEEPGSQLQVWVPANPPSSEEILRTAAEEKTKSEADGLAWITDPTSPDVCAPTEMYWSTTQWKQYQPDVPCQPRKGSPGLVAASYSRGPATHGQFFLSLPPTPALAKQLDLGGIAVTHSRAAAKYLLVGRWNEGQLEYAWVLPGSVSDPSRSSPLPPRSDWVSLKDQSPEAVEEAASELALLAQRLARVYGWLTLTSPADDGAFPYHLELQREACGSKCQEYKRDGDTVKEDEQYGLALYAKAADIKPWLEQRWTYVFVVDSWGCSQLLFPASARGIEEKTNLLPSRQGATWPLQMPLLSPNQAFEIGPPYGTDTYFLLTTGDPIADPSVFQFSGARTRGVREGGPSSPLEQLLQSMNSNTRGIKHKLRVPRNWSIEHVFIHSVGKPGDKQDAGSDCDTGP